MAVRAVVIPAFHLRVLHPFPDCRHQGGRSRRRHTSHLVVSNRLTNLATLCHLRLRLRENDSVRSEGFQGTTNDSGCKMMSGYTRFTSPSASPTIASCDSTSNSAAAAAMPVACCHGTAASWAVSRNIREQKYSVSRNISVQNTHSVGIFRYKILSR